ncbi:hypothetical protein [Niallia sp. 03091]|uniref:hypothetical protein n=1 Tax=Niallia sp. 03091 TaxID=3458059 RepID=UPI0040439A4B
MCQQNPFSVDEDYEAIALELEELNVVIGRLLAIQKKKEKQHKLEDLVKEMQQKGIKIDFAERASFFNTIAKNAVECSRELDKKRQQAYG